MKEKHRILMSTFKQFRKLNISMMIPDLNHSDFATLMTIDRCSKECSQKNEKVKVSMLSEMMHGKSTAVSRSLKSLEKRGFIQRTVNEDDRRITYVCLTQDGEKMLKSAEKIMDEFTDAVFGRLGEENLDKLIDYLNTLFNVASEEIELRRYDKKETGRTAKKGIEENE